MTRIFSPVWMLTALGVAGSVLWLPGCGADADKHAPLLADAPLPPAPVKGCEDEAYEYCDIRKVACQRRVYGLVACLRDVPDSEPPPIRVISEEEFRAEQALDWAESEVPSPNHFENALVLLGLVESGALSQESQIERRTEDVAAYYSTNHEDVTVIDHGKAFDDFDAVPLLAHEFVHAQQDQELKIEALWEAHVTTIDQALGLRSLIEGEATLYQVLVAASLGGVNLERLDLLATFDALAERTMKWLLAQPSPYAARWSAFPYGVGGLYAYFGWREFDPEGLRAQFADPPLSSQRLMASQERIAPELGAPIDAPAPTSETLGKSVADDVLGALGIRLFLRADDPEDAEAVALAWRGDQLWVYGTETSSGVVWTVSFANQLRASDFAAFAARTLGERNVDFMQRINNDRVTLMAATDNALLRELVAATDPPVEAQ